MKIINPFGDVLEINAKYTPDATAIIHGDRRISWKEFNTRVNKLANALTALGIRKGDKCAILFHNRPEFLEANFAAQKIGAVPVPVNFRYVAKEIEYLLDNSDAVVLIFEEEVLQEAETAIKNSKKLKHVICCGKNVPEKMLDYEKLIASHSAREPKVKLDEEKDVAIICYTGGTTGTPKGVVLTYENITANLEFLSRVSILMLPEISEEEMKSDVWAKNEFERRLFLGINRPDTVMGTIGYAVASHPEISKKTIVMYPEEGEVHTLIVRGGQTKAYRGMPKEYDLIFRFKLRTLLRRVTRWRPMLMTHRGRLRLLLTSVPYDLLVAKEVKIEGPFLLKVKFAKTLAVNALKKDVETKCLCMPPLFHMAAYAFMLFGILTGAVIIFPASSGLDAREVLEIIDKEKVQQILMVPTAWREILDYPQIEKFDLSSVLQAVSGGAFFSGTYKKRVLKLLPNALILDGFGQTEMAPLTTMRFDGDAEQVKDRCIGKPFPGIKVRIVNEKGEDVKPGETGELIYSGPTIMKEYYKDADKTSQVIRDGWFHSGDLAYFKDGEIYVVERKGECINSGAEKIYPLEVEEVLIQNPKVEGVCVIGVPDEVWGQSVRAVVQLKNGEKATAEEIIDFCKGKIAGYKKPKSVVFADLLPVTPVGKVMRAKVKELYGG
jgi:acyl-CoA synthetase (AMP-forming)/AMP-acid ligase II